MMNDEKTTNRRGFLTNAVRVAAGVASGSLLTSQITHAATPPLKFSDIPYPKYLNLPGGLRAGYDIKVLNYALALEDLESDLYIQALQRLTIGGVNKLGKTIPGLGLSSSEPDVSYMTDFAAVEAEHRDFLRGSLESLISGIAIKPFKYDFGIENKSRQEVLDIVLDAEATGTMAYLGAIPHFGTKLFLTAAAAIQGTEARHTATLTIVRNALFNTTGAPAPMASDNHGIEMIMEPDAVLAKVSPYIVK